MRAQQRARRGGDPLRVPQVAGVVVGRPDRDRMPLGDRPERVEELGQVADLGRQRRRPRRPASGESANSRSYSFIADPQPAELTTIASTPAASNVSIVRCANLTASAARPECSDSAPQQPCERGMITSQPSAASTRAVAALTRGKNTDCTHPVSMPTTARRAPRAATRSGNRPGGIGRAAGGASRSACSAAGETRPTRPVRAISRSAPVRCSSRSGAVATRSRAG